MTLPGTEGALRLSVALGLLLVMALWELAAPRRRADMPRLVRWSNNLALVALDAALVWLIFPLTLAGFAAWIPTRGWGLFALIPLPPRAEGLAAFGLSPDRPTLLVTGGSLGAQRLNETLGEILPGSGRSGVKAIDGGGA